MLREEPPPGGAGAGREGCMLEMLYDILGIFRRAEVCV